MRFSSTAAEMPAWPPPTMRTSGSRSSNAISACRGSDQSLLAKLRACETGALSPDRASQILLKSSDVEIVQTIRTDSASGYRAGRVGLRPCRLRWSGQGQWRAPIASRFLRPKAPVFPASTRFPDLSVNLFMRVSDSSRGPASTGNAAGRRVFAIHPGTGEPSDHRQFGRPRTNSMIAALTSPGRSCWVQWPQPGSIWMLCSAGTNCLRLARSWSVPGNETTMSRSPAT